MYLDCYSCGYSIESGGVTPQARCECGEPLWIRTESSKADADVDVNLSLSSVDLDDRMWAFEQLLPVDRPSGSAEGVGGTPHFAAPTLTEYAGCRVHLKDESENLTGSFKDRGSAVGVQAAVRAGAPAVGTVSHGNMAMSTAAFAAAADLPCLVLVPADISDDRLSSIARFEPEIVRVDGDYGRLYYRALTLGQRLGVPFSNSDVPHRVAGQKTTTLEILAATAPAFPDAIVFPASSGGHVSGGWKAIRELRRVGYQDLPRLYLAQAAPSAPIAAAADRDADAVTPVERGDTIAYSIGNADPPSGTRALTATRDTGGGVVAVTDSETREARRRLAADAGMNAEPSCATALAATRKLTADGSVGPDEQVSLVITGSGFKEQTAVPVSLETVSLEDLETRIGRFSS